MRLATWAANTEQEMTGRQLSTLLLKHKLKKISAARVGCFRSLEHYDVLSHIRTLKSTVFQTKPVRSSSRNFLRVFQPVT